MLHHNAGHTLLRVLITWRMIDKAVTITVDECAGGMDAEYKDYP